MNLTIIVDEYDKKIWVRSNVTHIQVDRRLMYSSAEIIVTKVPI